MVSNLAAATLHDVTTSPELWAGAQDPVRPNLPTSFKTAEGRGVFGLKWLDGKWAAFMCYARTTDVPKSVSELIALTSPTGSVVVPYTVWSHEKGAGRVIVNKVIDYVRSKEGMTRVVTLSPLTEMARKFHLRNGAKELQVNPTSVNFEYDCGCEVCECMPCDCGWGNY